MQAVSTFIVVIFGIVSAPYVVRIVQTPIREAWSWVPWLVVAVVGGLVAIPKAFRPLALGLLFGLLAYGLAVQLVPEQIRFVPVVPPPFY